MVGMGEGLVGVEVLCTVVGGVDSMEVVSLQAGSFRGWRGIEDVRESCLGFSGSRIQMGILLQCNEVSSSPSPTFLSRSTSYQRPSNDLP